MINAANGGTQVGLIRPEIFRGIGKYRIEIDLTVLAKGSGVSFWFHDSEPGTTSKRILYTLPDSVTNGTSNKIVIEVTTSNYSVKYTVKDGNGNTLQSNPTVYSIACSPTESFFALYLTQGAQVFVGGLQVTKIS